MHVISKAVLKEFWEKHSDSKTSLNVWYKLLTKNDSHTLAELQMFFSDVEHLGKQIYIFNIKGNHYRVICQILYKIKTVYIKGVYTHSEYDGLCKRNKLDDI